MDKPFIIGFLGDGQLARMSAMEANKLGYNCHFFGKSPKGPCAGLGEFFIGELTDELALLEFCQSCDVITLENEFIDSELLLRLEESTKRKIYPSAETFAAIENKFIEKETFKNADIPVCAYGLVNDLSDLKKFSLHYSYPLMLKATKGGYDGFGNCIVHNEEEALKALERFKRKESDQVIAEQMIPFLKEVAVTIVRSSSGEMKVYPVVDTLQENNICHYVLAPAVVTKDISEKIQAYASKAMTILDAVGVFSFEFFVLDNGDVLLNESAPRPHNSAHYTMNGCKTSQFENHIRAITGMPLGDVALIYDSAVMLNLLGTDNRKACVEQIDEYLKKDFIELHLYGKEESRVGRKMGHINLVGSNSKELLKIANEIRKKVRI